MCCTLWLRKDGFVASLVSLCPPPPPAPRQISHRLRSGPAAAAEVHPPQEVGHHPPHLSFLVSCSCFLRRLNSLHHPFVTQHAWHHLFHSSLSFLQCSPSPPPLLLGQCVESINLLLSLAQGSKENWISPGRLVQNERVKTERWWWDIHINLPSPCSCLGPGAGSWRGVCEREDLFYLQDLL